MKGRNRPLLPAILAIFCSGCTTYTLWPAFPLYPKMPPDPLAPAAAETPASVSTASGAQPAGSGGAQLEDLGFQQGIDYAVSVRDAYERYLSLRTWWSSSFGAWLIMAAGAAVGLGTAGVSGDPIIGLGAASGAGVGAATYLEAPGKLEAYREGMTAVQCVIQSVAPIALDAKDFSQLKENQGKLEKSARKLEAYIRAVSRATNAKSPYLKPAKKLLGKARKTLALVSQLRLARRTAGRDIISAVDTINVKVYRAANASEPTVADLKAALKSVSVPRANLTEAPPVVGSAASETKNRAREVSPKKAHEIIMEMRPKLRPGGLKYSMTPEERAKILADAMWRNAQHIEDEMNAIRPTLEKAVVPEANFRACLDPAEAQAAQGRIIVLPSTQLEIERGEKVEFTVSGGKPPYEAIPLERDLAVLQMPAGNTVHIEASLIEAAKPGEHHLQILDAGGHERLVTLTSLHP